MFILSSLPVSATEYKIVDIQRTSVFAGKLGQRVSEDVVIEKAGMQIRVHIAGSYHTLCVREGQRLHVGETISIRGAAPADGDTVPRGRIAKS